MKLSGSNPNIQEQHTKPFLQEKDTQTMEELQAQNKKHIPSPAKGQGAKEIIMQDADTTKGQEIPEV